MSGDAIPVPAPVIPSEINTDGQLRTLFGDRLYAAAQDLLERGYVRDVRVLQAGRIVTGIVLEPERSLDSRRPAYRIYIERPQSPRFEEIEAECSCGASGLCAHIAAVSMDAARTGPRSSLDVRRPGVISSAPIARPISAKRIGRDKSAICTVSSSRCSLP